MEQSWYRREMRRRPLMISTAPPDAVPKRRARRPPRAAPRRPTTIARVDEPPDSVSCSDSSDSSMRLSASPRSRSYRSSHSSHSSHSSLDLNDSSRYVTIYTQQSG
ncbi:Uncharacterized protein OBRU01_12451 [Operophtera brumata]|uniref:Uncharacterized protein n=1 Tax=Operophtera brumata TaxID=104452 RepID=A0A0L7LAE3_OPEBR|nr:Uncharacterized protein OBRU01_12451 [Operophtera brumata]